MSDSNVTPDRGPRLGMLLAILVGVAVLLTVGFGVFYYTTRHVDTGPDLNTRAVSSAEAAVKKNPNDLSARVTLAHAYEQVARPDDALAQYDQVLKVSPDNRPALLGRGQLLYAKGDYANALKSYQHLIDKSGGQEFSAMDPQLEEALFYTGSIYMKQGDYKKAVENFEKALKINSADADAWALLGQAQTAVGNYPKAAAAYNQALAFVPAGWCEPYKGLVDVYGKMKDPTGSKYAQAMLDMCTGNTAAGVPELEALVDTPVAVPAMLGLGLAAETSGDYPKAMEWYGKVLKAEPENVAALTGKARIEAQSAHTGTEGSK